MLSTPTDDVVHALHIAQATPRLWVATRGAEYAGLIELSRGRYQVSDRYSRPVSRHRSYREAVGALRR